MTARFWQRVMGMTWCVMVALLLPLGASEADGSSQGKVWYIAPEGHDEHAGTRNAPWGSLEFATSRLSPGDTLVFLPGHYEGVLRPTTSGRADAPITFRSEARRQAVLVGREDEYALQLEGVAHIKVEGFTFRPGIPGGRWLRIHESEFVHVDDVLMEEAQTSRPFVITHSEQIRVENSTVRKLRGNNLVVVENSRRILFVGNSFSRSGHDLMLVYPDRTNEYVVFRGNVFDGAWGRTLLIDSVKHALFEENIITNSYDGGRSADSRYAFYVTQGIFRFNRVFNNWGERGLVVSPYRDTLDFKHVRLYHNAFYDNSAPAVSVRGDHPNVEDAVFLNNLFTGNDMYGDGRQIHLWGSDPTSVRFQRNAIGGAIGHAALRVSVAQVQAPLWVRLRGRQFDGNIDIERLDVQASGLPVRPGALVDAGSPLTHTAGDGQGNAIPVEDARSFYDGFGISGERGDVIAVGSSSRELARIVRVDYGASLLFVDRPISWMKGDPVSLPWAGEAPDIGVYERDQPRKALLIEGPESEVRPGERVEFSATLLGSDEAGEVRWWLGDGSVATGTQVSHMYAEPDNYPVRVLIILESGVTLRGTAHVVVRDAVSPITPLLHSSFGDDDEEWWWRWQTYRPEPTAWAVETSGDGGGVGLHVWAPRDGTLLPARVHPQNWDIERYPFVTVRYRIEPGSPIGVYIEAFPNAQGGRRLWLAATQRTLSGAASGDEFVLLHDDRTWHTVTFDVRAIRAIHPEVRILDTFAWEAPFPERVRADGSNRRSAHGYWIDEVVIGSARLPGE